MLQVRTVSTVLVAQALLSALIRLRLAGEEPEVVVPRTFSAAGSVSEVETPTLVEAPDFRLGKPAFRPAKKGPQTEKKL
jgi:hypothetical protein